MLLLKFPTGTVGTLGASPQVKSGIAWDLAFTRLLLEFILKSPASGLAICGSKALKMLSALNCVGLHVGFEDWQPQLGSSIPSGISAVPFQMTLPLICRF